MKYFACLIVFLTATFASAQSSQPFLSYSNIDEHLFSTCGSCGNSSGNATTADYQQSIVSSTTLDGRGSEFYLHSPAGKFSNAYWYNKWNGAPSKVPQLIRYSFSLYIPSNYSSAMHAIEFATGMRWKDAYMYRFAWQMNFGSKMWRVYDPYLKKWVETGIALQGVKFGSWNTIMVEGAPNTSSRTTKNLAVTINGVRYTTKTVTHARKESSSKPYFVNAFQLDSDKQGDAYGVFVDKMTAQLY